jgi:hypothetical protein
MANELGARHWLGMKVQAVAGTPETTVNTFFATREIELALNPEHIERKASIATGRNLPMLAGLMKPGGKATIELCASQPHPFFWALGTDTVTNPATGVYLHTITEATTGPKMLTVEADRVFDQAKQGDAYLSSVKLTATPGEIALVEMEWLAKSHTDGATLTSSPTFVTDPLTCTSVSVSIGGTTFTNVESVEITYEPGLEQAAALISDSAGLPAVVRKKEPSSVKASLKFLDVPASELAKLKNATSFALVVELQGAVITGAYRKFVRVTLPACQYTGGLAPTIGQEVITADAEVTAFYDTTTGHQIKVEAQNTLSTL